MANKNKIVDATAENKSQELQTIYINPLTDFGFKRVFSNPPRGYERLISFLKAFLLELMRDVVTITYRPTELIGENSSEKRVIFDIYCVTNNNQHIIIEMQRSKQSFFSKRIITYDSRIVSSEVKSGDMEYNIPTVISFNIMDYNSDEFSHSSKAFHVVKLKDDENVIFFDKKVFCFLELSKFAAQNVGQLKDMRFDNDAQRWSFVLKNMHIMEEQNFTAGDDIFRDLFEDCKIKKLNNMEKKQYKKSIMDYYDVRDAVNVAREDGIKLGYNQGIEQGRSERNRQIAFNLLENGLDIITISKVTGLSKEEISALTEHHV